MSARALVIALAVTSPLAAFVAGAGLFQGWIGWDANGSRFLADELTRSNVVAGGAATLAWGAPAIATRGIRPGVRLSLLATFFAMVAIWFLTGIHQLIVL